MQQQRSSIPARSASDVQGLRSLFGDAISYHRPGHMGRGTCEPYGYTAGSGLGFLFLHPSAHHQRLLVIVNECQRQRSYLQVRASKCNTRAHLLHDRSIMAGQTSSTMLAARPTPRLYTQSIQNIISTSQDQRNFCLCRSSFQVAIDRFAISSHQI
jgi:hypothetical protein